MDYKISWQCESIHIAFKTLEEVPFLVALLSEGKHPTDGNDIFLFLLIIYFVSSYQWHNQNLQWFCWFTKFMNLDNSISIQEQEVNPKFIATGCRGAVSMSSMVPFHPSELSALVTSCWIQGNGSYDISPLIILDRSHYLWECFQFHDDMLPMFMDAGRLALVFVRKEEVVEDVRQSLLSLDMVFTDASV